MSKQHEQSKSGREDKCHGEDAPRRVGGHQGDSQGTKDEGCQGAIDSDSSWENKVSSCLSDGTSFGTRQEIIEGILRQLRNLQAAHLAYVKSHKERLETRLKENERHQENIAQEMKVLEEVVTRLLALEQDQTEESEAE